MKEHYFAIIIFLSKRFQLHLYNVQQVNLFKLNTLLKKLLFLFCNSKTDKVFQKYTPQPYIIMYVLHSAVMSLQYPYFLSACGG